MENAAAPPAEPPVHRIPCTTGMQAGYEHLVGRCPCGHEWHVTGEGHRPCTCGRMLEFKKAA